MKYFFRHVISKGWRRSDEYRYLIIAAVYTYTSMYAHMFAKAVVKVQTSKKSYLVTPSDYVLNNRITVTPGFRVV